MTKAHDLICFGRSSLDLFANELGAKFADVKSFSAFVGGSPTNVCVSASRLGLKTAMVTGLGDDYTSGFIRQFFQNEGINTEYIALKGGYQTNTVMVALQPPVDMQFVALHANNADLELTIDDMQAVPVAQSRAVLFSGMCLLQEPSRSATQYIAELARLAGTIVFMDLDYRAPMWSDPRIFGITVRLTLPLVDIAIGTEDECRGAGGTDDLDEAIERLLSLVQTALIVKRGAQGSTVYTKDGQVIDSPPFKVDVTNFLGAGDAYAGATIYAYLNGWDWEKSARFANACGAYMVAQHGTANAMPTLAELEAFIEKHQ